MGASQRHKCMVQGETVIYDGSCPAYASDTYPPGSDIIIPDDRPLLSFNGVDTKVVIPWTPNPAVASRISFKFKPQSLKTGDGQSNAIMGCSDDFAFETDTLGGTGMQFAVSLFGVRTILDLLASPEVDGEYIASISWPAIGTGRVAVNQLAQEPGKGETAVIAPLEIGFRPQAGLDYFHGIILNIVIVENNVVVHRYPLNEGVGIDAIDTVGGANGTITNPTWLLP